MRVSILKKSTPGVKYSEIPSGGCFMQNGKAWRKLQWYSGTATRDVFPYCIETGEVFPVGFYLNDTIVIPIKDPSFTGFIE